MAKLDVYIPERHRIVIPGKVQGVGFRLWLRNVASSLSLVGSCRQLPDGACEAIVQGEKTLLKQFIVACKRGPAVPAAAENTGSPAPKQVVSSPRWQSGTS